MERTRKKSNACIKRMLAVGLITVLAMLSCGCSFLSNLFKADDIKFTRRSLSMQVGDSYDISAIIETESEYTISSADSAIVEVEETTNIITALAVGTVYITAETDTDSAKIKVVVSKKEEDSIAISAEGDLVQTSGNTTKITFTVTTTGAPSKTEQVIWLVNGEQASSTNKSTGFEYTPNATGEFSVTAKCGEFVSNEIVVRVFNAVTATVDVSGELKQDGDFTDIVFTVTAEGEQEKYFQYFEDDRLLYEGDIGTYTYSPTPGRHTLSVKVNGRTEYVSDAVFRGAIMPTVGGVVFDNLYPHAYLQFDAVGKVKVEITSPGGVQEYSQSDSQYSGLFDENGFDVAGLIDLCATGDTRRAYKFRVKSLGDDDAITESDYSDYSSFMQLPAIAEQFVTTVLPCGDLYVTSEKEYVAIVEYYVFFREKKANATVSFKCYIGYDRAGSALDLWHEAFPIATTSGTYSAITVTDMGGGVMRTSFTVSSVNSPSRQTESTDRAAQLHAVLPHINYDASKNRPDNYTFPIDRLTRTAAVTHSDELYLAAQSGVKPVPETGSVAQTIYERARKILRSICTDEMTDVQKAHAIYDWIMWRVTYDTPATRQTNGGESLSAYYMEGVFGDGVTAYGGKVYDAYAVCDGMSKAYALMCNIEGIPCVRVVGRAGKNMADAGGHAWNKVYVNGAWYVTDCTWGDSHVTFALDGPAREYELGMHSHLFLTDAQVSGTHFEPYRYGETSVRYAPQTAATPINLYKDMTVNEVTVNCYISNSENQQNRVREIAVEFAKAYKKNNGITVPDGVGGGAHNVDYQAIEVYAENGFTITDSTIVSTVTAAIRQIYKRATVKVLALEESVLILMKA